MARILKAWEFLLFMFHAAKTYRSALNCHVAYAAVVSFGGVPRATLLVARGREAWRVSTLATEAYEDKPKCQN